MTETIFECESMRDTLRFKPVRRHEYYEGDYQILPSADIRVRIEKGLASTYSLIKLNSSAPLKFRRSWRHIRQDRADICVLWFVKRGRIVFSQTSGAREVRSGHCMVSRSLTPFRMDCLPDDAAQHEVLHLVAPTHMLAGLLPTEHGTGFSFAEGNGRIALKILELLYEEGASVSQKAADGLAQQAISAIGGIFADAGRARQCSAAARHFDEAMGFIERHLGNPSLSAAMVARGIGISYRHLLHVLKSRDAAFSDILWTRRMELAKTWLAAGNMRHFSISQISYMSGFKSPAHFSRMFKNYANATPSEFRSELERLPV